MLWIKAFHIIFMVTWFAGLFYLPRLFVYHTDTTDDISHNRFLIMERRLLIMTHIGGSLTILFGLWLMYFWRAALTNSGWLHVKLLLVAILIAYHVWCARLVGHFRDGLNTRSSKWFRGFNEIPSVLLIAIILLVVLKPF